MAIGGIYPLVYLRQNFKVPIFESFAITISQIGQCYPMLGVIFRAGWRAPAAAWG